MCTYHPCLDEEYSINKSDVREIHHSNNMYNIDYPPPRKIIYQLENKLFCCHNTNVVLLIQPDTKSQYSRYPGKRLADANPRRHLRRPMRLRYQPEWPASLMLNCTNHRCIPNHLTCCTNALHGTKITSYSAQKTTGISKPAAMRVRTRSHSIFRSLFLDLSVVYELLPSLTSSPNGIREASVFSQLWVRIEFYLL